MIKINLGKLLYIFCLMMLPIIINAKVVLDAPNTFYKNDVVQFKIIATGSEIGMPIIKNIDGNIVEEAGTSRHTTVINGARSYRFIQTYAMKANKDIKIPSFDVKIDGKIEKTDAKTIKMLQVSKTKSALYDLQINVDKKSAYVGEAIEFTLKFKYKKDLDIVSLDYVKPSFENFWVKEIKPQQTQNTNTQYLEQEIKYLLFPQKSGKVEFEPVKIGVSTVQNNYRGGFFLSTPTVTTPVYSNKLSIDVKALPAGINLIGDFNIKATVDKTVINQGDAVSYKLYIEGRGNIDDLDDMELIIPDATIYDNPAKKEYNIKDNLYGGQYSKIFSIVGKKDFIIPSVEIKYFDKKTKTTQTIRTKEYNITVNNKIVKEKKLEVAKTQKENEINSVARIEKVPTSDNEKVIYFIMGLICGISLWGVYTLVKNKGSDKKEIPLIKSLKNTNTPTELFKILVVYINIDEELDKIIYRLENISLQDYKKEKKNIIKIVDKVIKKDKILDI